MKNDTLASIGLAGVARMHLETGGGVTHQGDVLQIFEDSALDAAEMCKQFICFVCDLPLTGYASDTADDIETAGG